MRAEAATPGKLSWQWGNTYPCPHRVWSKHGVIARFNELSDAEFLACAHEDIPALLAHVAEQQAVIERLRERDAIHRTALVSLKVIIEQSRPECIREMSNGVWENVAWVLEDHARYVDDTGALSDALNELKQAEAEIERLTRLTLKSPSW